MKNISEQLSPVIQPLKSILSHHAIIVTLIGLLSVVYAVFTINQLLAMPDDDAYRAKKQAETVKTKFDQDTINKLERLRDRQQQITLDLPGGRIDPFIE